MSSAGTDFGLACALTGVGLLRWSWAHAGRRPFLTALGWLVLCAGALAWLATGAAPDKAVALAVTVPSLAALALVAGQVQWRRDPRSSTRQRRGPPAQAVARESATRGPRSAVLAVRITLAGPMALAAALALTALTALRAPWSDANRLVAAGFMLPLAWAVGALWALMDGRLLRIAAGLMGIALAATAGALR